MDHLHKQLLTSRNVAEGPLVDFMLGGLNYQTEHHLFPSMPRPLLKMAQPVVRQYCHEVNPPYRESGFAESMREIHAYLRQAGA